jgi:AraC family L-rhamnose operon regulatory protein RhaS
MLEPRTRRKRRISEHRGRLGPLWSILHTMARAPAAGKSRSAAPPPPLPPEWSECVRGEHINWENRRVRSEVVCFGEVMYRPGGISGPRQQRDFQLVFLHSGELTARVDGGERRLSPGDVGLFLPGKEEFFAFSALHESHHSWCSVAPSRLHPELQQLLLRVPQTLPCDEVQARLLAAGMALGSADSEIERGIVDQIGVALFGAYANAGAGEADRGVVALAVRYMEEHLTDRDCLKGAHLAAGVSRNTMISRFRSELGVTPARHLWRLRAERGMAMLAETGRTVAEVAYACGFSDPFHFSRLVKALQGAPPSKLRRKG